MESPLTLMVLTTYKYVLTASRGSFNRLSLILGQATITGEERARRAQ